MHAFLAALLVTLAASVVHALPAWRPVSRAGGYPVIPGDHGSCAKMGQLCTSDIGTNYNALVASGASRPRLGSSPAHLSSCPRERVRRVRALHAERHEPADVLQRHGRRLD
jgi:hypothetical protein